MKSFLSLIATPAIFEEDGIVRLPNGVRKFLATPVEYRGKAYILCHIIPLQGLYVDRIKPVLSFPPDLEVWIEH